MCLLWYYAYKRAMIMHIFDEKETVQFADRLTTTVDEMQHVIVMA